MTTWANGNTDKQIWVGIPPTVHPSKTKCYSELSLQKIFHTNTTSSFFILSVLLFLYIVSIITPLHIVRVVPPLMIDNDVPHLLNTVFPLIILSISLLISLNFLFSSSEQSMSSTYDRNEDLMKGSLSWQLELVTTYLTLRLDALVLRVNNSLWGVFTSSMSYLISYTMVFNSSRSFLIS